MTDMLRKICSDYGTWLRSRIAFYCSYSRLFEKWPEIFNLDPMHSYNEIIIIANAITLNQKDMYKMYVYMPFTLLLCDRLSCEQSSSVRKKKKLARN